LLQALRGDLGARLEPSQVTDVDHPAGGAEGADRHRILRGRAPLLAHPHVRRHLPTLEAGSHRMGARARLLTLDSAPRVAALARTEAPADALPRLSRLGGLEVGEVQVTGHLLGLLDLHEMADLPEHTGEHRPLLVVGGASDLAQPQRPQRAAVPAALADLAPNLGDANLRHCAG